MRRPRSGGAFSAKSPAVAFKHGSHVLTLAATGTMASGPESLRRNSAVCGTGSFLPYESPLPGEGKAQVTLGGDSGPLILYRKAQIPGEEVRVNEREHEGDT